MSDGEPDWPESTEVWVDVGYLSDEPLAVTDLSEIQKGIEAFISYLSDPDSDIGLVWTIEDSLGIRH